MTKLELTVSVDDANLILEALGEQPFSKVYGVIADLQRQAQSQLNPADDAVVGEPEAGEEAATPAGFSANGH